MEDGAFAFIQAVFHVLLFIVVHGNRARNGVRPGHKNNRSLKPRRSHETRDSISKQIARSQELQAKPGHSNPLGAERDLRVPARRVRIEARN
jgi:hypothetical protein